MPDVVDERRTVEHKCPHVHLREEVFGLTLQSTDIRREDLYLDSCGWLEVFVRLKFNVLILVDQLLFFERYPINAHPVLTLGDLL